MDLLHVYRLYRRMHQYPNLIGLMRSIFLDVLDQRGLVSRERLYARALEEMKKDDVPDPETNRLEYVEALIDILVVQHLNPVDIENYINLARKRDNAQTLSMLVNRDQATSEEIVRALREFCDIPKGEVYISREEAEGIRVALISRFISNQLPFISLAKNYITIRDTDAILQHTLLSRRRPGKLGGKAAGMILAHKILLPTLERKDPELEGLVRVPDTWYLNSGVFSEFLDRNNLYLFHTFKYKDRESIEKDFLRIEKQFKFATFAPEVVEDFRKVLEGIGQHPIIIRSSSMLEDNFGLPFSGKYQSVFLTNQGDIETRLSRFLVGLKKVFASTFGPDPILYRRDHGLLDYDERMAMVVQKVVGRRFGDFFFPFAAGVMFSRNVYAWNPKINKEAGLVRLVHGLGTRAVDRVLCAVAFYGFHRYVLVYLYIKHRKNAYQPIARYGDLPRITSQLPMFNEVTVAETNVTDYLQTANTPNEDGYYSRTPLRRGNPVKKQYDINFNVGGPLWKQKAWFFYSYRLNDQYKYTLGIDTLARSKLSNQYTFKGTFQLNQKYVTRVARNKIASSIFISCLSRSCV